MDEWYRGARPTLRVLKECLSSPEGWDDPEQYRAVRERRFKDAGPLAGLSHRIVQDGRALNADPASAKGLTVYESSLTLSGRPLPWRELHSGQWRGLAAQAEARKHWWILHAGLKRTGDRSNVYRETDQADAKGLEALYPGNDDLMLLALEESAVQHLEWQRACAMKVLSILADALEANAEAVGDMPRHPARMGVTMKLSFEVDRFEPEELAAEGVSMETADADILVVLRTGGDWNDSIVRSDTLALVKGLLDPVEEHWEIVGDLQRGLTLMLCTSESRLAQIKAAVRLDGNEVALPQRSLKNGFARPSITYAHFAPKGALTDAYVFGEPCEALCGQSFVPSRDPASLPICPACLDLYEKMT